MRYCNIQFKHAVYSNITIQICNLTIISGGLSKTCVSAICIDTFLEIQILSFCGFLCCWMQFLSIYSIFNFRHNISLFVCCFIFHFSLIWILFKHLTRINDRPKSFAENKRFVRKLSYCFVFFLVYLFCKSQNCSILNSLWFLLLLQNIWSK